MEMEPAISAARHRIESAYSPDLAKDAGRRMIDMLAEHLRGVEAGTGTVLPWLPPPENIAEADKTLDGSVDPTAPQETVVETIHGPGQNHARPRPQPPRPSIHRPPGPCVGPLWAASSTPSARLPTRSLAIYDMGPWATAVEWALVQRLGSQIGWTPGEFSGLVTHGRLPGQPYRSAHRPQCQSRRRLGTGPGRTEQTRPCSWFTPDAHYSVARSAGILGLGSEQVLRAPLDERRRMDPGALDELLGDLRAKHQPIVAVAACACATSIGAFDPLKDVADVCQRHGVWLHVDAAHGGAASFSPRHCHLLEGIERADSIVWDAHKMMFVPALCAFVLYRKRGHKFETFRQDAPYLFDPAAPGLARVRQRAANRSNAQSEPPPSDSGACGLCSVPNSSPT